MPPDSGRTDRDHPSRDSRPVLCLITDRRRLVASVGASEGAWQTLLLTQISGAIAGGVDVVQIRENDLDAGVLAAFVRRCLEAASGHSVRILVNDRLDVALATGAHGVHLREGSPHIALIRAAVSPSFAIGRSIHDAASAASARRADYLIAGSVYETASKPGAPAGLGLNGLEAVVQAAGPCPVWAIGGVTLERIPALVQRGARGVAAIGAFMPPAGSSELATAVQKVTTKLRFSFDSSAGLP